MTRTASGASEAGRARSRLARAGVLALVLAVVVALGLLASACGGGSSNEGVAQVETTDTTTTDTEPADGASSPDTAAFSACMRRNGVPNFPDPDANGRLGIQAGPGLDPNSPRYKAAEKACEKYMPRGRDEPLDPEEQAEELENALEHAACMRENGVPGFPDPKQNAEGGLSLDGDQGSFDPFSPQYKKAEEACRELAPGGPGGSQMSPAPSRSGSGATP